MADSSEKGVLTNIDNSPGYSIYYCLNMKMISYLNIVNTMANNKFNKNPDALLFWRNS
jgi:hypothetical protein